MAIQVRTTVPDAMRRLVDGDDPPAFESEPVGVVDLTVFAEALEPQSQFSPNIRAAVWLEVEADTLRELANYGKTDVVLHATPEWQQEIIDALHAAFGHRNPGDTVGLEDVREPVMEVVHRDARREFPLNGVAVNARFRVGSCVIHAQNCTVEAIGIAFGYTVVMGR